MNTKRIVTLLIIAVLALTACNNADVVSTVVASTATLEPSPVVTQVITMEPAPTATPTAIATPVPAAIPISTPAPTPVAAPSEDGYADFYKFSGGPEVLVKADCFDGGITLEGCIGQEIEVYLAGDQANDVYLNGFDAQHQPLWGIRLIPGHNRLLVPQANRIAVGNTTNVQMEKQQSSGFYSDCERDDAGLCTCQVYNFWVNTYQNCHQGGCWTTIEFESEYGDTMYVNNWVNHTSVEINSGDVLWLPSTTHSFGWDLSTFPIGGEN